MARSLFSDYTFPKRVWEKSANGKYTSREADTNDGKNRKRVVSILSGVDVRDIAQDQSKRNVFYVLNADKPPREEEEPTAWGM